jgi:aminoglycoside phosphotransferase (APT) family kinase protein
VITALGQTDVPVPRTYCYCDDRSLVGTPFYVMEFAAGRSSGIRHCRSSTAKAAPRSGRHQLRDRAAAQGRLRGDRARRLRQAGQLFRAPDRPLVEAIPRIGNEPIESMDRLIEWLPQNNHSDAASSIVHGDFRLDNLIVHPTEPRVIAVLDWELSTLGHPLADFSYHVMVWRLSHEQFRGMAGRDFAALGIPTEREYVDRYCARTDRASIDPRIGSSASSSACSALPRSCRASPSAC